MVADDACALVVWHARFLKFQLLLAMVLYRQKQGKILQLALYLIFISMSKAIQSCKYGA